MKTIKFIPGWAVQQNSGFIGGHYIRPFGPHAAGYGHDGHKHYIDHITFIESGAYRVEGEETLIERVEAPNFLNVEKDRTHRFVALEDGSRHRCIFAKGELLHLDFLQFLEAEFGSERGKDLFKKFQASDYGKEEQAPYMMARE